TAMGLGDTEITATIGEVEKTCTVHVVAVAVNSITLPAEANVTLGSSLQLNPTVDPAQAASEYTITYVSSAPEIATVDANGKVVGVAAGDAVITATIADKSAQITIHVVAAQTFAKVTDASTLADKDTIILALRTVPVIAGARDGKKLTVLLNDVTVTETEAYADNACRFVLGKEKNKDGFTLTIVGGKTIAVANGGNDIVDANTQNCKFWEFVADGNNGYFVRNLGNTNAMFKYHAGNAAIKPYKASTAGAVYVYAYVRKYVEPGPATDVENTEVETKAQKVLRNGQILILRGDAVYTITGVRVE
ncbi:MAG: Ig-like domain-containing protein, partial [Paludibacteraceae bacterium]|nr:Ig-like domain-containing protein [Paludibacteraceae bacterium]